MLYKRQKTLLSLLSALGGRVENLDFQKLLFLYCQEADLKNTYEFVPYKFGAFSFTSYADRRNLIAKKLLADEDYVWQITEDGRKLIETIQSLQLSSFVRKYRSLKGDKLVVEAYKRYPYYATRSEIAERVLFDDTETIQRIKDAVPQVRNSSIIFTIGYEGRMLEGYLNELIRENVTLLCDVRKNPISRKYGFSKKTLANGCNSVGIRYEHLPELGIVSEKRKNLKTQSDYDALFSEYECNYLPGQKQTLMKIQRWITSGERVALTCFEHLARQCHRNCVIKALNHSLKDKFIVKHL